MQAQDIDIVAVSWQQGGDDCRQVRQQVFIDEQGIPPEQEWDEHDASSWHFVAYYTGQVPVGTVRIRNDGRIGRLAVLPQWRGQLLGSALLETAIQLCLEHKLNAHLSAQAATTGFYTRFGFVTSGDSYTEAGIEHIQMRLQELDIGLADLKLGETGLLGQFDSRTENRDVACNLVAQARHAIRILTPNLENPVYDNPRMMQAMKQMALNNRRSQVRVLVRDSIQAVKLGHRMIELARQMTSSFALHIVPAEADSNDAAYLLADDAGYLYKHKGELYQGQYNFNDRLKVRDLAKEFDELWEISRPDPELRRLYI